MRVPALQAGTHLSVITADTVAGLSVLYSEEIFTHDAIQGRYSGEPVSKRGLPLATRSILSLDEFERRI